MERRKIVIIGAGSAMFTQGLVADLIHSQRPWRLGLVDIDPQALETGAGLARRMVEARQADITVEASTDRRELLPWAEVVVTTIGVGGRRAWLADVTIPRRYGIFQPVGDSIMPGGISRALRMVPAMVDIARDVLELSPAAHFFNYANPMTVICTAVRRATGANIVGLCIGVYHVQLSLASLIGAPAEEVTALAAGVNHFTWIWDLRWQGRDAWPLVRQQVDKERARAAGAVGLADAPGGDTTLASESEAAKSFVVGNPFCWSLFDAYGAYPSANDRHVSEFFPERFPGGRYYGKTLGVDAYSLEDTIAWGDRSYERMRAQARGEMPLDARIFERGEGEHSQLVEILRAIDEDRRESFSANLPNRGAVPNLPADAVLELTSIATARGLRPVPMPDFPDLLAAPLARKLAGQAATVEAALTGSRKLFVEALLLDGSVADESTAGRLADDLLKAQAAYLPQFA